MQFKSFKEFYPFYLGEHSHKICRLLHFIGTFFVICLFLYAISTKKYTLLLVAPLIGYGFAWTGHFVFEKNRPATFKYPLYSFVADFVMFWHLLTGKLKF
jgi:hypothetical protein